MTAYEIPDKPKMLRETLCVAQAAIRVACEGMIPEITRPHTERLGRLIVECDRHRPLGPNGTHGDLHTATCGCEDVATERSDVPADPAPEADDEEFCLKCRAGTESSEHREKCGSQSGPEAEDLAGLIYALSDGLFEGDAADQTRRIAQGLEPWLAKYERAVKERTEAALIQELGLLTFRITRGETYGGSDE